MSYEYILYLENNLAKNDVGNFIKFIKTHPWYSREYDYNNKTWYEFRYLLNTNIKNMPNFSIILESNKKIYVVENGQRDIEIWSMLEHYFISKGGFIIKDLQE